MLMVSIIKLARLTKDFHTLPQFNLKDGLVSKILQLREGRSNGNITPAHIPTTRTGQPIQMISEDHTFTPPSKWTLLQLEERRSTKIGLKNTLTGLITKQQRPIQDFHTTAH